MIAASLIVMLIGSPSPAANGHWHFQPCDLVQVRVQAAIDRAIPRMDFLSARWLSDADAGVQMPIWSAREFDARSVVMLIVGVIRDRLTDQLVPYSMRRQRGSLFLDAIVALTHADSIFRAARKLAKEGKLIAGQASIDADNDGTNDLVSMTSRIDEYALIAGIRKGLDAEAAIIVAYDGLTYSYRGAARDRTLDGHPFAYAGYTYFVRVSTLQPHPSDTLPYYTVGVSVAGSTLEYHPGLGIGDVVCEMSWREGRLLEDHQ
ncbi:MAG: hypothetical protein QM698_17015 [Micropepsaceae bacterium]